MVYQIHKKVNGMNYFYLVKNIRIGTVSKKINIYIGKIPVLDIKQAYFENMNFFVKKEFDLRTEFEPRFNDLYDLKIYETVRLKSIEISNKLSLDISVKEYVFEEFSKEFVFNSNKIEGSKIPRTVFEDICNNKKTEYKNRNEIVEVQNSISALKFLESKFKFNIVSIKKLYLILTGGLLMANGNKYPKGFKKHDIIVGNSKTTAPENVESELNELLRFYREQKHIVNPLELAFLFHLKFEATHPFEDGNGRTGRMILNKLLTQFNFPPIIVFQDNRMSYFNAILKGREGSMKKYNQFMLSQMRKSYFEFYTFVLPKK